MAYWSLNFRHHFNNDGMTNFYLLPTVEFFRDRCLDDIGDFSFDISFAWLFWSLTFTRYWGDAHEKKN